MSEHDRRRIGLILEQHLGHRTYAENLRRASAERSDVDFHWTPVTYDTTIEWPAGLGSSRLTGALAGRHEVRKGLALGHADVWIYNTQVPAALAGRRRTSPYVVVTDVTPRQYDDVASGYGHKPDPPGPLRWMKHRLNVHVFERAAACVAWSNWVARSLTEHYGVDQHRIRVIPPGVDLQRWSPRDTEDDGVFRVLFVGGDFERKGGDVLLKAFSALGSNSELVIVTKSHVPSADRVRVVNDLEPNDPRLSELFRQSDVFVLPSRAETFGIAAVEACASGLPVVASRLGGLPDIVIEAETGFLIDVGDADACAHHLLRLERDRDLRQRLGTAARAHAERAFEQSANANRLFDLALACVDVASA